MEIRHEIVRQLAEESKSHYSFTTCKKALKKFHGDFDRAKLSLMNYRWGEPLSGVVYHEPYEDEIEYVEAENFREFDKDFWTWRYMTHQEVKLDKDGKIIFDKKYWPERVADLREIERIEREKEEEVKNWKVPTIADIIMSSVNQFINGVAFENQLFTYKFTQQYVNASGMNYHQYDIVEGYHIKEDNYFIWLRFPMKEYMEWNKITFDGEYYTFNGKSVSLEALKGNSK